MTTRGSLQRGAGQQQFQGPVRKWKRDWVYLSSGSNAPAPKRLKLLKWVQLDERVPENSSRRFPNLIPLEKAKGVANQIPGQACGDAPITAPHLDEKGKQASAGVVEASLALQAGPGNGKAKGIGTEDDPMEDVSPSDSLRSSWKGPLLVQANTGKSNITSKSTCVSTCAKAVGTPGTGEGDFTHLGDIDGEDSGRNIETDLVFLNQTGGGCEGSGLNPEANEVCGGKLISDSQAGAAGDDFIGSDQGDGKRGFVPGAVIPTSNTGRMSDEELDAEPGVMLQAEHIRTATETVIVEKERGGAGLGELDGHVIVKEVDGGIALQGADGDVILQEGDKILGEVVSINDGVGAPGEHGIDRVGFRMEGLVEGDVVGEGVQAIPMESIEFVDARNIEGIEGMPHVVITTGAMVSANVGSPTEEAQAEDLIAALSGEGFDIEMGGASVVQPGAQDKSQAARKHQRTDDRLLHNDKDGVDLE